jgi:hypothetical protein
MPTYTNAENQRNHREKMKRELGMEEYRRVQADRKRRAYHKNRPVLLIPEGIPTVDTPNLKPLKKRHRPIIKSNLKDVSANVYATFITKFYNENTTLVLPENADIILAINSKPYSYKNVKNHFKFLFNKKVFDEIVVKYKSKLNYLYAIFSRVYGFTPIVKKLYPYISSNIDEYEFKRAHRVIPDDVVNSVSFKHEDVINNVNNVDLSNHDKIIALLTLLLPTRRLHDYRLTKISTSLPDDKFDNKFNYYYDGSIYIYNTKVHMRNNVIKLPDDIIKLIDLNDEFLVGKFYEQSRMSFVYSRIMQKIYKIKISASLMRILYSSYLRSSNLNTYEWKKKAESMGHSIGENLKYSYIKKNDIKE